MKKKHMLQLIDQLERDLYFSQMETKFTGCKDLNGTLIYLGDKVLYKLEGKHTKEEYWNPIYEVIFTAPMFTLKHIGGGKDGGSHLFILQCGGGNGNLLKL